MSPRLRLLVLALSTPIIGFAVIGGFLGKALARDETYQHLKVFEDVISLILNNYVDDVDINRMMVGALQGLADGLDADSAFLTEAEVKSIEARTPEAPGDVGLELTRQYYLRVIAPTEGSPAARAGLRPNDFIRAIDSKPTRDMSVFEGRRRLRGPVGSRVSVTVIRGNAAEPHVLELTREKRAAPVLATRTLEGGVAYVRVPAFTSGTAAELRRDVESLTKKGVKGLVIDLRWTAEGPLDAGIDAARLFVGSGTLAIRAGRGSQKEVIAAAPDAKATDIPVALLIDRGTAGPAELFAAALMDNKRAQAFGERTSGRAAIQKLVKLPDDTGLWLSYLRYLTPAGTQIHEKGLAPHVEIEQPDVEFGGTPPAGDATLDRAVAALRQKA